MKNKGTADYYNALYSSDEKAFSGEPLPVVKVLAQHLAAGKVLEIGAGSGRNSLYLAAHGYEVAVTDISSAAIEIVKKQSSQNGLTVKAEVSDIAESGIEGEYDAIICTFMLHHLLREDAAKVVKSMQEHIKAGGFNLILAFTKNGDFFRKNPDTPNFYPDGRKELESMYSGWNFIKSFEKEGQARALDKDGGKQFNVFAGILAQKAT